MSELTRYWITFTYPPVKAEGVVVGLWHQPLGFGVTAVDLEDALEIVRREFFERNDLEMPPVRQVVENVDVSTLDEGHVRPNLHPPNWRGVWYPKLRPLS
jgi:hypothetical protein